MRRSDVVGLLQARPLLLPVEWCGDSAWTMRGTADSYGKPKESRTVEPPRKTLPNILGIYKRGHPYTEEDHGTWVEQKHTGERCVAHRFWVLSVLLVNPKFRPLWLEQVMQSGPWAWLHYTGNRLFALSTSREVVVIDDKIINGKWIEWRLVWTLVRKDVHTIIVCTSPGSNISKTTDPTCTYVCINKQFW